jgi:hypothetical protein
MPMLINEIGWPTQGGGESISETQRAKAYRAATVNIPRTNCNVMGILPQAWTSAQQDPKNPEDWYGIANPSTAKPYSSAHAYSNAAKLMRGQRSQPPPNRPLIVCPGMPAPTPPGPARPNPCTMVGTPAADRLDGTARRDVVCAFGGRDEIRARGGRDVALGADGPDRIAGGSGKDRLNGGTGRDRLDGGPGRDVLIGGPGRDVCVGKRGHDRFRGCEKIVSR